ncbi:MAG TPA: hypothetical protein VEF04_10495, partial [Blastocatellia bacterium]|nr:hypothetical protein [Blastocatellia bacterium]
MQRTIYKESIQTDSRFGKYTVNLCGHNNSESIGENDFDWLSTIHNQNEGSRRHSTGRVATCRGWMACFSGLEARVDAHSEIELVHQQKRNYAGFRS